MEALNNSPSQINRTYKIVEKFQKFILSRKLRKRQVLAKAAKNSNKTINARVQIYASDLRFALFRLDSLFRRLKVSFAYMRT